MSYGGVSANANLSAMSEGCRLVDVDQKHLPFFFFQFILSSLSLRKSECSASYDVHSLLPFCLKRNFFNLTWDCWENLPSRCFYHLFPNWWSPVAVKPGAKEEFFPIVINFVLQKFPKEKKGKIHKKLRSAYVIS